MLCTYQGGTSLKAIGAWRRRAHGHARSDVDTRPRGSATASSRGEEGRVAVTLREVAGAARIGRGNGVLLIAEYTVLRDRPSVRFDPASPLESAGGEILLYT